MTKKSEIRLVLSVEQQLVKV